MLLAQTAQCAAMTEQGSCALPNIPLEPPPLHRPLQNTGRLSLQAPYLPTHTTHRPPLAVTDDHIKKSSPLSGSSWPCYSKCCCHGHLVQLGLGDLCRRWWLRVSWHKHEWLAVPLERPNESAQPLTKPTHLVKWMWVSLWKRVEGDKRDTSVISWYTYSISLITTHLHQIWSCSEDTISLA